MTPHPPASRFRLAGVLLGLVLLGAVAAMKLLQAHGLAAESARRRTEVAAGPRVRTLVVRTAGAGAPLGFQGEALPIASTTLYSKLSGFVKVMRVDKGSRVRQGDLLAVLESPETDRQTLALKASAENAQRVADRLGELGREGIANAQDVDNARSAAKVAQEQWAAQRSTQDYERVLAPFAGVVTARMVDPGAFVQNASGSTSSQPLLSLADTRRLRVDFFLDPATAVLARVGQELDVSPADRPDQVRRVRIERLAGTLDLRTRTMLAEAELDNRDGAFLAGGSVQVALHLPKGSGRIEIPAEAVLMRGPQAFAAAVAGGRVRLLPLVLGADVGSQVQVLQGLPAGSRIILNPVPGLNDGDALQLID